MKERPILMAGPMARGSHEGWKTQTRRLMNPQPIAVEDGASPTLWQWKDCQWIDGGIGFPESGVRDHCPYGDVGDRLWVRETWADTNGDCGPMISYRAGGERYLVNDCYPVDYSRYPGCQFTMWCGDLYRRQPGHSWRPSIHMPRWACRTVLEITDVRVEKLQHISEEDARAEGIRVLPLQNEDDPSAWWQSAPGMHQARTVRESFTLLWDTLAKPGETWDDNPWVWVIGFRRVEDHGAEGIKRHA